VDIDRGTITPMTEGKSDVLAVIGKAGSGKTLLLAELVKALEAAGVEIISGDWEGRRRKDRRTMAILAPTNKAASVLRARGVPATTIHRILYTPVYDPEYEKVAEWLAGQGERPVIEALTDAALDRAKGGLRDDEIGPRRAGLRRPARVRFHHRLETPGQPARHRLRRRKLDARRTPVRGPDRDLPALVLFGDPAQLAPVGQSGEMVFDRLQARPAAGAEPHPPAGGRQPDPRSRPCLGDPDLTFDASNA
jgi:exodeoxyribonuclease-5